MGTIDCHQNLILAAYLVEIIFPAFIVAIFKPNVPNIGVEGDLLKVLLRIR
jgi:hypothetical protein